MGLTRTGMSLSLALLVVVACSRREDDRSIKAAPEQATPAAPSTSAAPESAGANAPVANPLAMPLKHDGPAQPAAAASAVDPCAVNEPSGALAMPLKHGEQPKKNPLCMKLK